MKEGRSVWLALLPLFVVLIIDTMGVGLIFPILGPLFIGKAGMMLPPEMGYVWRDIFYAITSIVFGVCVFIGAPILGDLSDHLGRKKVLIICLLLTAIGLILSGVAITWHSVALLIVSRGLTGLAAGSQPISQAAIADVSTQENKAANFSLVSLACCTGFLLGPIVSGYFATLPYFHAYGYATPFYLAAALALANTLLLCLCFKETYYPTIKNRLQLTKGFSIFIKALKHPVISSLSIMFLCHECAWALYVQYSGIFFTQYYNYTTQLLGYFMSWIGLIAVFTLLVITRLVRKRPLQQVVSIALLFGVLSWLVITFANVKALWLLCFPVTVADVLSFVGLLALFSNSAQKDEQGWVMGVSAAMASAGWSLGGMGIALFARFNRLPFFIAALVMAIALVIALKKGWLLKQRLSIKGSMLGYEAADES